MAFNTTSFFAGVGSVVALVTVGFAGGAMLAPSPKMEPNRLERLAAVNSPAIAAKAETPPVPSESPVPPPGVAKNETAELPAPDRSIATTPAAVTQPAVPPPPQPVVAKEDVTSQIDNAKKVREGELRKQAEFRESERRAEARRERRKRQEIDAAADAVRQMKRDGVLQEITQQDDIPRPGLFGFGDESPRPRFFGRD
jgi:hypothetical protein